MPKKAEVQLSRVIGNTARNANALAINPSVPQIAYPAGCVVVLYHVRLNKQEKVIIACKSPIASLTYSKSGRYLAVGESGENAKVIVWDLFGGHRICKLAGEWESEKMVFSTVPETAPLDSAFDESGSFFACCGKGWISLWTMDEILGSDEMDYKGGNGVRDIAGEKIDLRTHGDKTFVSIQILTGEEPGSEPSIYVLSSGGILFMAQKEPLTAKVLEILWRIIQWVDMRLKGEGFCLSVTHKYLAIGGKKGRLRLFEPKKLKFIITLPSPSFTTDGSSLDVCGCFLSQDSKRLVALYKSRDIVFYDISDPKGSSTTFVREGKTKPVEAVRSLQSHSGAISELLFVHEEDTTGNDDTELLVSSSSDGSIRVWDVTHESEKEGQELIRRFLPMSAAITCMDQVPGESDILVAGTSSGKVHVLGRKKLDVLGEESGGGGGKPLTGISHAAAVGQPAGDGDMKEIRKVATTDEDGNVRIYNLSRKNELDLVQSVDVPEDDRGHPLIGGLFVPNGSKLMTCARNGTINVYSSAQQGEEAANVKFDLNVKATCELSGMDLHPNGRYVVTAGSDGNLHIFGLFTGKEVKAYPVHPKRKVGVVRVNVDPSALFVAASCDDNSIRIVDWLNGKQVSKSMGHGGVATRIRFSSNCKSMYSASEDGCIFVYKVSKNISEAMLDCLTEKDMGGIQMDINSNGIEDAGDFDLELDDVDVKKPPAPANRQQDPKSKLADTAVKPSVQPVASGDRETIIKQKNPKEQQGGGAAATVSGEGAGGGGDPGKTIPRKEATPQTSPNTDLDKTVPKPQENDDSAAAKTITTASKVVPVQPEEPASAGSDAARMRRKKILEKLNKKKRDGMAIPASANDGGGDNVVVGVVEEAGTLAATKKKQDEEEKKKNIVEAAAPKVHVGKLGNDQRGKERGDGDNDVVEEDIESKSAGKQKKSGGAATAAGGGAEPAIDSKKETSKKEQVVASGGGDAPTPVKIDTSRGGGGGGNAAPPSSKAGVTLGFGFRDRLKQDEEGGHEDEFDDDVARLNDMILTSAPIWKN
eukprot:jgi/Bigna1/125849/aug1.1_g557